jgi:lipopolysaccharide transport system permease protein
MLPPSVQPWLVLNPFADLMAVVHALVQGMPLSWGNFTRLGVLWVVLLVPAWTLFLRSEPHMRETL